VGILLPQRAVPGPTCGEWGMPILLWYLPFTMFSGACDLVFAELVPQADVEPADLDEARPEEDATQH
jgi:hypothetical protein